MAESGDKIKEQIRLGEDTDLELKTLKFSGEKVSGPERRDMADELAAMANTESGSFILGVDDKTRAIEGIPDDKLDTVETWIREICNDLVKPQLFCRIKKFRIDDGETRKNIILVSIPRSLYVHQSPGGYFQRLGSSKREMPPDILARLFQQRSQARIIHFDEQYVAQAEPEALEKGLWQKFKSSLSPHNEDDETFLLKLKLLSRDEDGNIHPSVSGILMASRDPTVYMPNAFIQAVFYRGKERNASQQLDARDIKGPLDEQVAQACSFVERNMKIRARKIPARVDIPQYSMAAVFEAVVNAVAHRDYSIYGSKIRLQMFEDRLELYSPGAIPNTMTIESMPLRQACRNELLTSLLARCPVSDAVIEGSDGIYTRRSHLMDKRGEGVPIILSETKELTGLLPVYHLIDGTELLLTLPGA